VTELAGTELPSLRMVLGLFLHHRLQMKETIRQPSAATVQEIAKFVTKQEYQ